MADTISDWTREEELKREAAEVKNISPAEHPEGCRSVPDADRKTQNQGIKISNLLFSDLQTQLQKEEPNIREGSLKVSYSAAFTEVGSFLYDRFKNSINMQLIKVI